MIGQTTTRGQWTIAKVPYRNSFYIMWRRGKLMRTWEVTNEYLNALDIPPIWSHHVAIHLSALIGGDKKAPLWRRLLAVLRGCRKELNYELKHTPNMGQGAQ